MHIHPLYIINQWTSQSNNQQHSWNEAQQEPKLGLTQAGSPRSGERSALAQAADFCLGETAIVALEDFASSRLGEVVSPEWDSSSLENIAPRLGERSSKKFGEFLLFSPRRDELAWARILVLSHCSTRVQPGTHSQQHPMHFHNIISNTL